MPNQIDQNQDDFAISSKRKADSGAIDKSANSSTKREFKYQDVVRNKEERRKL
jgi:hypothetical protein